MVETEYLGEIVLRFEYTIMGFLGQNAGGVFVVKVNVSSSHRIPMRLFIHPTSFQWR